MVVSNGIDYVGSDNGTLYALDGASGKLLWRYTAGTPVYVSVIDNGIVYSTANKIIFALAAGDGKVIWQRMVNDYISSVILDNGIIYAGTEATGNMPQLFALRAIDGSLLWHYTAHSFTPGLLAVSNGVVYYAETMEPPGSVNEYIRALQGSDGHMLWQLHTTSSDGFAYGIAVAASGIVYISAYAGAVYAVRASDGTLLWHVARSITYNSVPSRVLPLVENGVVYITGKQGPGVEAQTLYALRASDGKELWSAAIQTNPGPQSDQPLLANGIIYVSTVGTVTALSAANGSTLWKHSGDEVYGPAFATDGVLYVNSSSGIIALRASNGALLWQQNSANHGSGMSWATPEVIAGDEVYVSSPDGIILAFDAGSGRQLWRYAIYK